MARQFQLWRVAGTQYFRGTILTLLNPDFWSFDCPKDAIIILCKAWKNSAPPRMIKPFVNLVVKSFK